MAMTPGQRISGKQLQVPCPEDPLDCHNIHYHIEKAFVKQWFSSHSYQDPLSLRIFSSASVSAASIFTPCDAAQGVRSSATPARSSEASFSIAWILRNTATR